MNVSLIIPWRVYQRGSVRKTIPGETQHRLVVSNHPNLDSVPAFNTSKFIRFKHFKIHASLEFKNICTVIEWQYISV